MKHTNGIAIVMIALLTLSVCGVASVTTAPIAAARTATETILGVADHATPGGKVTITGYVRDTGGEPSRQGR